MTDLDHWPFPRGLGGDELAQAMLTVPWFVHPDDVIGGWCVTVVDLPPSAGYPTVADFVSRQAAEHIVALHNATLGL